MSWQDRDYASADGYRRAVGRRGAILPPGITVNTMLIVVNVAVFVLDAMSDGRLTLLGAMYSPAVRHGQIWRLVTYQYLHVGVWHLFLNMLALYFLGRYIESHWGRGKYLIFYTACGTAGAIVLMVLQGIGWLGDAPLIGASGSVLGVLGACAVLFPGIQLIVYFFPMRIRTAAGLFLGLYILNLISRGGNAGGDAAHLGGLILGAAYAYWQRGGAGAALRGGIRRVVVTPVAPRPAEPWSDRPDREDEFNREVDRILAKIKEDGITTLTPREKRILAAASERQQKQ